MKYLVNGTHPHPDYCLASAVFTVRKDNYGNGDEFSAYNKKLGSGKLYATPEKAIRKLCQDHAIMVLKIERTETE